MSDQPAGPTFSASLRVFGDGLDPDGVSKRLGVTPDHTHRKGQTRTPAAEPWEHDMWNYTAPIDETRPLGEHIQALWDVLKPHSDYIRKLKSSFEVDVFCGFIANSDHGGFDIENTECLELFTTLGLPFRVSAILF